MENSEHPAFPTEIDFNKYTGVATLSHGLTKREYFAGLAMQGLMSNVDSEKYTLGNGQISNNAENKAKLCIMIADELLKQLNENK